MGRQRAMLNRIYTKIDQIAIASHRSACLVGLSQAGHEFGVFGGVETALEHVEQPVEILTEERGGIEPQPGKDRAAEGAVILGASFSKLSFRRTNQSTSRVEDTPDDVFADTITLDRPGACRGGRS